MKLWDKGHTLDKEIEQFTVGNDYELDKRLVLYDARASSAHAAMLHKGGFLTKNEFEKIKNCLEEIEALAVKGAFEIKQQDEDCHTAIENYLITKIGEDGKKVHTARSRNDQVLAALRLFGREEAEQIKKCAKEMISAIQEFKAKHGAVKIPGYTHMQRAMPTTIGLWIGACEEALEDDLLMLENAINIINQSPLGAAAGYGVPVLEIDRAFVAQKLGFEKVQNNTLYVQNSRGKFELLLLQALQQMMLDLNKLANDIVLFTTAEYNFLKLPIQFCTGSSIMPQKKNPDVIELLRAKTAMFSSYPQQIVSIITNLPSGYNRDFQLTKEPFMQALVLVQACVRISTHVLAGIEVQKENCETAAASKELYATEEAYKLVKQGMSFRDAYKEVGKRF